MSEEKDKTSKEINRLLEQYEKEQQSQDLNVNVKVDTSQIQKELMSWRLLKKKFVKKAQELGIEDVTEDDIQDYSDLEDLSEKMNEKKLELELEEFQNVKSSSRTPSGSVPLSSQQTNEPLEFETHKEMINFLYKQSHSNDRETREEAQKILDKLFEKWARGFKDPAYRGFSIEDKEFSIEKWRKQLAEEEKRKRGVETEEGD